MITLRRRLQRGQSEDGLTLIEVIVAMVIFMIVSTGLLYTMMSLLSVNRDSRNRQVAANLAAQEIDLARDIYDIFRDDPLPKTYPDTAAGRPALNNDTFTVTRTSTWVYSNGVAAPCGSGSGTMRFKLVVVDVTWLNMKGDGVQASTYINPNERLNDPTKGTLIVAVKTDHGEPVEDVVVTATPTSGTVLTGTTDAAGCLFLLGVTPGDFTVKISSPPGKTYVDMDSIPQPTQPANVVAGTSVSLPFTFDPGGTIRATYNSSSTFVPINQPTSLISTRDVQISATTTAANPRSFLVSSAYTEGFSVVAGDVANCFANDPTRWVENPAAVPPKLDGELPDPTAAGASSTVDVTVPTGALTVTGMTGTNKYLVAVSHVNAVNGQPGCATTQTLRFAIASLATMTFALPYGSWDIYRGSTTSFAPGPSNKLTTGLSTGPNGTISSGVVTFDPRGT